MNSICFKRLFGLLVGLCVWLGTGLSASPALERAFAEQDSFLRASQQLANGLKDVHNQALGSKGTVSGRDFDFIAILKAKGISLTFDEAGQINGAEVKLNGYAIPVKIQVPAFKRSGSNVTLYALFNHFRVHLQDQSNELANKVAQAQASPAAQSVPSDRLPPPTARAQTPLAASQTASTIEQSRAASPSPARGTAPLIYPADADQSRLQAERAWQAIPSADAGLIATADLYNVLLAHYLPSQPSSQTASTADRLPPPQAASKTVTPAEPMSSRKATPINTQSGQTVNFSAIPSTNPPLPEPKKSIPFWSAAWRAFKDLFKPSPTNSASSKRGSAYAASTTQAAAQPQPPIVATPLPTERHASTAAIEARYRATANIPLPHLPWAEQPPADVHAAMPPPKGNSPVVRLVQAPRGAGASQLLPKGLHGAGPGFHAVVPSTDAPSDTATAGIRSKTARATTPH